MNKKTQKFVSQCNIFLIIIFSFFFCKEKPINKANISNKAPDFKVPVFHLAENLTNKEISLATFKNKPAVILFTASYCPTCEYMFKAFAPYVHQGVFVFGVGAYDKEELFRLKIKSIKPQVPVAFDTDNMAKKYGVEVLPHTVFINAEGKIHATFYGTMSEERIKNNLKDMGAIK
ncbi:MAG: TlpA family protein disulfide reductase [Spirochaetia bacterium]|nr:TlpA family protein disulfide reductase [Spirochaetia bacterium]